MSREKITSKRSELKERRQTLRHSIINEKRQTDQVIEKSDFAGRKIPVLARRALCEQAAKDKAAQATIDLKKRKAVASKEILKARPPFNNFVRVVHTGLTPYRTAAPLKKAGTIQVGKSRPPGRRLVLSVQDEKGSAPRRQGKTALKIPDGVVHFGKTPPLNKKTVFKPPVKVQPLPLTLPLKSISSAVALPKKGNVLSKLRTQKTSTPNKLIKKNASEVKRPPQRLPLKSVVPKRTPEKVLKAQTCRVNTKHPVRAIHVELNELKKGLLVDNSNLLNSLHTMTASNKNAKVTRQKAVVPSSTRVLRSSVRLQESSRGNRENQVPTIDIVNESPGVGTIIDERSLALAERKERLNKEIERLNQRVSEWQGIANGSPMPSTIADEIDAVTGQTNLLLTKKFKQFEKLIVEAQSDQRTTLDDLDGFWEMMYIQVIQLDGKYGKLEKMKNSSWESLTPKPKTRKRTVK